MPAVPSDWQMPNTEADLPFTSIVRRCSWSKVAGMALWSGIGADAPWARAIEGRNATAAKAETIKARRDSMTILLGLVVSYAGGCIDDTGRPLALKGSGRRRSRRG